MSSSERRATALLSAAKCSVLRRRRQSVTRPRSRSLCSCVIEGWRIGGIVAGVVCTRSRGPAAEQRGGSSARSRRSVAWAPLLQRARRSFPPRLFSPARPATIPERTLLERREGCPRWPCGVSAASRASQPLGLWQMCPKPACSSSLLRLFRTDDRRPPSRALVGTGSPLPSAPALLSAAPGSAIQTPP